MEKDYDDDDENVLLEQIFVGNIEGFREKWLVINNITFYCNILLRRQIIFITVYRSPPRMLLKDCKRKITFYAIVDKSMWNFESDCFVVSIISQEINNKESLFGKFKRLDVNL